MSNYESLDAPEVASWRSGFDTPPDLLATTAHFVGFDKVMVVAELLWPTFAIERGCVLLPWSFDDETLAGWWQSLDGDVQRIEGVLNHLHLWDVFDSRTVPAHALEALGRLMAKTWAAALADQVGDEPDDYGPTVSIGASS